VDVRDGMRSTLPVTPTARNFQETAGRDTERVALARAPRAGPSIGSPASSRPAAGR